jgi:transcriptional regulator with XRE-family HTH domain
VHLNFNLHADNCALSHRASDNDRGDVPRRRAPPPEPPAPVSPSLDEALADLGARIRARRSELRLTLQQLADRMETDPRQLRRIERGETNISVDSMLKLASALHLGLPHLWSEEFPPAPPPRVPHEAPPRKPRRTSRTPSERLAERVVALRQQRGMTQRDLSARSGLSLSLVRGIENGRNSPTLRSLEGLARALGVEVVSLL